MNTFGWLVVFALALAILNITMSLGVPVWLIVTIPFIPIIITLTLFIVMAAIAAVVATAAVIGFIASDVYDSFKK